MNTPRNNSFIDPEDPKWTAYVLGELDETERAGIERLLETSDEARALVEELTVATATMKDELSSFMPLMMSPEQRAAIRSAAEPKPRRWFEVFPSKWGVGLAAAAVLVMAVALPLALRKPGSGVQVLEGDRAAAPVVLPEVTIVRNDPQDVAPKSEVAVTTSKQSERKNAATAAPVLTPEQFAALAQDGPPVANPAAVTPPPVTTAVLAGTVQDSSSAFIPGVRITATNTNTGTVVNAITNESGAYRLPSVQPGTYQVSATLPGFQTQTVTNLPVGPRDEARVNYTMQVASTANMVQVSVSDDKLLQTNAASVGEVLTAQRVTALPLVGNNVLDLISVLPGTKEEQQLRAFRQSAETRDGLSDKDNRAATPPPSPPLNITTRSGTTSFEGQALQQGQQGQQGGQGQGAAARGGGGRGGAAPAGVSSSTVINPDTVSEIRLILPPVDAELGRGNARVVAGAPPPPPPAALAKAPIDNNARPVPNTEAYDRIVDNPFIRTTQENLATFSIDVDTASYANVRRFLNQNQIPPGDAVRIEELVNYFNYDYAQPTGNAPIAPNMEVAAAPWNPANRLVRIGIKAREVNADRRPPSNLVFLIDVSGSMNTPEKLPLVKAGLNMLVERLGENDTVSIVVYAGNSGLVLAPTSGLRKEAIRQAIDSLQPGGSTNGASGIQLAYNQATINILKGGVNRVILMTDGDFNVGVTNQGDLTRLIEERAKSGVFLNVLGFGMGNYKDSTLEKLADRGNGAYAYIDNIAEARKVLVEEMSGTLVTVAKDVKIQVDFNPARAEAYRLIGYENRALRTEDFNNDAKDAGDMGAGHTVTALFEVVPKGGDVPGPSIDPSIYTQQRTAAADAARPNAGSNSNELLTLRLRYKQPDSDTSTRMDVPLVDRGGNFARATTDFKFAASVAEFGMILRNSPYKGTSRMDTVLDIVEGSLGQDRNGYRKEFLSLVQKARNLGR